VLVQVVLLPIEVSAPFEPFWNAVIDLQASILQFRRLLEGKICGLHQKIAAIELKLSKIEAQRR
jgi:hypothetical protein